jgi:glycosyltransferase involved in cell wall biosynthesis
VIVEDSDHDSVGVSVALCTRNGERFIGEQLASILAQSRPVRQMVISDDASSDDTVSRVRTRLERGVDAPVTVVIENPSPLGVVPNFAQAIGACDQEIIALSDQDDIWEHDRIAIALDRFGSDDSLTLLHTDAVLIDESGRPTGGTLFEYLEVTPRDLELERSGKAFEVLLRRNLATGATVVFRRRLLEDALPFPPDWVHDEWLAIVAAATGGTKVVSQPTIQYRLHSANQIGVAAPTLRRKIARVLEPRAQRNAELARRAAVLVERLTALGPRVLPGYLELAKEKARFEAQRARLPHRRFRRFLPVLKLARSGDYQRLASRGAADIVRDILQPA